MKPRLVREHNLERILCSSSLSSHVMVPLLPMVIEFCGMFVLIVFGSAMCLLLIECASLDPGIAPLILVFSSRLILLPSNSHQSTSVGIADSALRVTVKRLSSAVSSKAPFRDAPGQWRRILRGSLEMPHTGQRRRTRRAPGNPALVGSLGHTPVRRLIAPQCRRWWGFQRGSSGVTCPRVVVYTAPCYDHVIPRVPVPPHRGAWL